MASSPSQIVRVCEPQGWARAFHLVTRPLPLSSSCVNVLRRKVLESVSCVKWKPCSCLTRYSRSTTTEGRSTVSALMVLAWAAAQRMP